MDWLKTVVPAIATALGGPLAGAAVSFIADKLGVPTDAVTDLIASNKMTPEQVSALKLAEIDFQKFLESNKIDLAKLDVENVKDARKMRIDTGSYFPEFLSALVTIGFFGILGWMMYKPSTIDSQPLLIMLGTLGAGFGAVMNFWLGSNKGSDRTKELLAQSAPVK